MAVTSVMGVLKPVAKFWKRSKTAAIDNAVFALHYKCTTSVLLACCILVTTTTLVGEPIHCLCDDSALDGHFVNTFCWIQSTYTLPPTDQSTDLQTEIHPGLRPGSSDDAIYHSYYQWVPFVLFLQSMLFYSPHYLWKSLEGSLVHKLTSSLRGRQVVLTRTTPTERYGAQERVANYLVETVGHNWSYVWLFFLCEALNLVNVLLNVWLMDKLLGGMFLEYGIEVLKFSNLDQGSRNDSMITIFPRITKCSFNMYGPSGNMELHDSMCILASNNLNEKIYIFLWFWLMLLAIMSALLLLRAFVVLLMSKACVLKMMVRLGPVSGKQLSLLVRKASLGDVWLWQQVANNVPDSVFVEILQEMCSKFAELQSPATQETTTHMNEHPITPSATGQIKVESKNTEKLTVIPTPPPLPPSSPPV